MDELKALSAQLATNWDAIYQQCVVNETACEPHLQGLSIEDIDETFSTLRHWVKSLEAPKRTSALHRTAKSILRVHLNQLLSLSNHLKARQYNHFPSVIAQLANALGVVHTLSVLSKEKDFHTGAKIASEASSVVAKLEKTAERSQHAIEAWDKADERAEEIVARAGKAAEYEEELQERTEATRAAFEEVEKLRSQLTEIRDEATKNSQSVSQFSGDVEALQEELDRARNELEAQIARAREHESTIDSLLPGATSAGLAAAFKRKVDSMWWSKVGWVTGFILAIVGLIALMLYLVSSTDGNGKEIYYRVLEHLPIAAPLVWLGWFSARQYGHIVRIQEDYSFKESISRAFEGYKKQMSSIDETGELVATLSAKAIAVLGQDPLRNFHRDISEEHPIGNVISPFRRKTNEEGEQA